MNEKRFLRVVIISLILFLGILVAIQTPVFAQADPNIRRTGAFLPGYPYPSYGVYPLAGAGVGALYPAMGLGVLPYTQSLSVQQNLPYFSSSMNSYLYRDILTLQATQSAQVSNPFMTYASNAGVYADPISQAAYKNISYSNVFGVNLNAGQGYYMDPFYSTAGKYINYASPVGSFSFDSAIARSPVGIATNISSELSTGLFYYGTNFSTSAGITGAASSTQHASFGTPFVSPVAGRLYLVANSMELNTMNQYLSNQYMYTREGMPFIANVNYFNEASVGGTNWYFAGDVSASTTGIGIPSISVGTGAQVVGQIPTSWVSSGGSSGWPSYTPGAASTGAWGGWTSGGATGAFLGSNTTTYGGTQGFTYTGAPTGT